MNQSDCWADIGRLSSAGKPEQRAFAARYAPALRAYFEARWADGPLARQSEAAVEEIFREIWHRARAQAAEGAPPPGGLRAHFLDLARAAAGRLESKASLPAAPTPTRPEEAYHAAWARVVMRLAAVEQAERVKEDREGRKRVELLRLRYFGGIALSDIARLWKTDEREIGASFAKAKEEFESALLHVIACHAPGPPEAARAERDGLYALLKAVGK